MVIRYNSWHRIGGTVRRLRRKLLHMYLIAYAYWKLHLRNMLNFGEKVNFVYVLMLGVVRTSVKSDEVDLECRNR